MRPASLCSRCAPAIRAPPRPSRPQLATKEKAHLVQLEVHQPLRLARTNDVGHVVTVLDQPPRQVAERGAQGDSQQERAQRPALAHFRTGVKFGLGAVGLVKPSKLRFAPLRTSSGGSYHKLTLACLLSASLEVHLPTVGRRALVGSYDF